MSWNDNCLFMPVVSSDGENAGEGDVEGGRNPEHLDSLWKNWICTQERRGKGESRVTPGCQGECLVMANPCTKAQNAGEACTLHSLPSSLCHQADVCGRLNVCGRSITLWLLIGFGLGAAPAETGIWEEGWWGYLLIFPGSLASRLQALSCWLPGTTSCLFSLAGWWPSDVALLRAYLLSLLIFCVVSVQSLSRVQLFATPWTAALQALLSSTISQSLLKLMSFESVMPSKHLTLCRPLLLLPSVFASIRVFSDELALHQCIGASASASVLPMNIQGWFPLGLTGWISLQSKGLSRVFSNTTVQKHQFFSVQPSLWSSSHICTWLLEKPYIWSSITVHMSRKWIIY